MDFATILAMLQNPGEDGHPEGIYDDLSASYTDATSTRDAKIEEQGNLVAELTAELTRTKLLNYELMLSQVAEPAPNGENEESNNDESGDDIGDDDDFFEKDDDN